MSDKNILESIIAAVTPKKKTAAEGFWESFGIYKNEATGSVEKSGLRSFLEFIGIVGTSAGLGYGVGELMDDQGAFGATIGSIGGGVFATGREAQQRVAMANHNKLVEKPEVSWIKKLFGKEEEKKDPMEALAELLGAKKEKDPMEKLLEAVGAKKEKDPLEKLLEAVGAKKEKSAVEKLLEAVGAKEEKKSDEEAFLEAIKGLVAPKKDESVLSKIMDKMKGDADDTKKEVDGLRGDIAEIKKTLMEAFAGQMKKS